MSSTAGGAGEPDAKREHEGGDDVDVADRGGPGIARSNHDANGEWKTSPTAHPFPSASSSSGSAVENKESTHDVDGSLKAVPLHRSPSAGVPIATPSHGWARATGGDHHDVGAHVDASADAASGAAAPDMVFLSSVGLERFAPGLRARGFHTIDDYLAVRSSELLDMGLSLVEVNIFKLLQAQIHVLQHVPPAADKSLVDQRVDDMRKSQAWIPETLVECGICEEPVVSTEAARTSCCRLFFCHACLRKFLSTPIMHDQSLRCPSPNCQAGGGSSKSGADNSNTANTANGSMVVASTTGRSAIDSNNSSSNDSSSSSLQAFSPVTVAAIFQDHCVICCQKLLEPQAAATTTRNTCAGLHSFCTACLRSCVVSMIRSHRIPRCPRWRECHQQFLDAAVVDQLLCGDYDLSLIHI